MVPVLPAAQGLERLGCDLSSKRQKWRGKRHALGNLLAGGSSSVGELQFGLKLGAVLPLARRRVLHGGAHACAIDAAAQSRG